MHLCTRHCGVVSSSTLAFVGPGAYHSIDELVRVVGNEDHRPGTREILLTDHRHIAEEEPDRLDRDGSWESGRSY